MDAKTASISLDKPFPRGMLGWLDEAVAKSVVSASGDVAMVVDRDGVICDMAFSNEELVRDGAESWLDRRWLDTVSVDSRPKVDELLRVARSGATTPWREVNQIIPGQNSMMIRFVAMDAGREGRTLVIGRDGRESTRMQQRLMEAQQAMERDYSRLRDVEFRYRLLFRMSAEAVVVVDSSSRKVVEANPAAEQILAPALVGQSFSKIFDPESQEAAASLLAVAQSAAKSSAAQTRLSRDGRAFHVSASLFRQDRASQCLIKVSPVDPAVAHVDAGPRLDDVLERIPDPFVVTDQTLRILTANTAFLDAVRIASIEQATGQILTRFLGRAGLERNVLLDTLKAHGSVRNFATVLRNQFDEQEDVEASAVAVPDRGETTYGFTLRPVTRRAAPPARQAPELRRSVEQLTELVGRVTLKELVRETTDLVERLCIEAALELTKDNRASAAEILGVSRQSLYSKLHRFGLGNLTGGDH